MFNKNRKVRGHEWLAVEIEKFGLRMMSLR